MTMSQQNAESVACVICGLPRWPDAQHECPPAFLTTCAGCGATIGRDPSLIEWAQWVDTEFASAYCETHYDDCRACESGEPHPHWPVEQNDGSSQETS